jgi:hypothetical protein
MMTEQKPLPIGTALKALARCAATSAVLLAQRRVHQPRQRVGQRLRFADDTVSMVYQETALERAPAADPAVLVVKFRLRLLRGRRAHALFRAESVLNTPLFVGFPGFVSKLWLAHDGNSTYRGFYQWDGPQLAEDYARALWWVLALVSQPGSLHYQVLPGVRRDELLNDPHRLDAVAPGRAGEWWRLTAAEPAVA